MKCSPFNFRLAFLLILSSVVSNSYAAIRDNFDDGNDNGWTRYEPLAAFGAPGTFSFPVEPLFGPGYRIQTPVSPDPATLGFGRAGSFRFDEIDIAFSVSFLLKDWDNSLNQSIGCIARAREVGFGTTDGYLFSYSTAGLISIFRMANETLTPLATSLVLLDPSKDYLFSFSGIGEGLNGRVFETSDLVNAVGSARILDSSYSTGINGLFVMSNTGSGTADATFDRFETGIVPEPSTITLLLLWCAAGVFYVALRRRRNVDARRGRFQNIHDPFLFLCRFLKPCCSTPTVSMSGSRTARTASKAPERPASRLTAARR